MSKAQREKGKRFERFVASLLRANLPGAAFERSYQYRGGGAGADVSGECFAVECKHKERANIREALKQAIESAGENQFPVAVVRDNGGFSTATMQLDDWLVVAAAYWREVKSYGSTRRTPTTAQTETDQTGGADAV